MKADRKLDLSLYLVLDANLCKTPEGMVETTRKAVEGGCTVVQLRAPEADPNHPTGFCLEETPFLHYAEYVKNSGVRVVVSGVGGYQYMPTCEQAVAEGKLDPILAFTTGKLKVEGNIDKALRLKQIIDSKKA